MYVVTLIGFETSLVYDKVLSSCNDQSARAVASFFSVVA